MNAMRTGLTRRGFVTAVAAGAQAVAGPAGAEPAAAAGTAGFPIIGFTKPFIGLSCDETADLVADVGWDGVELPVRDGTSTHIPPAQVEQGLPAMVDALRKRGKEVSIVTTSVLKLDTSAERVLRTTAALGIKRVRLGFMKYPREGNPAARLPDLAAQLRDVAALAAELGLQAGYQNHSGRDFVGAPLWDLWLALKDLDPAHAGVCFDIGHATLEGGLSWPVQARLLADRFVAVYCKDFFWEKTDGTQTPRWCPFGAGAVSRAFFAWLQTTNFRGPLSQHHEYPELGTGAEMVVHFKRDLAALREWLAAGPSR